MLMMRDHSCLCSQGFTRDGNLLLITKLRDLGFDARLWKTGKSKSGEQLYSIGLTKASTPDFLDYIGPCPPEISCYGYKWGVEIDEPSV